MSVGGSRGSEFITEVVIWNPLSGGQIWAALEQGAMDDLQCFPPDCDVHVA